MNVQVSLSAMKLGPCLVDTDSCSVLRDGEKSKVTPRSMDVLLYLAEHADRIVSSDELLDTFWSPLASDHAVHKAIAELRSALGDSVRAQRFIKTIPKRGYKLLVVPARMQDEQAVALTWSDFQERLRQWFSFIDRKALGLGLFVLISLGALALFHPYLEQASAARQSLVLAQYPFQQESNQEAETGLFAQALYANLVTRLSEQEALRIIPMGAFGRGTEESGSIPSSAASQADFEVRGAIVQTESGASLYINLVNSRTGIVAHAERLEVRATAAPVELDPLTERLVDMVTSQLLPVGR